MPWLLHRPSFDVEPVVVVVPPSGGATISKKKPRRKPRFTGGTDLPPIRPEPKPSFPVRLLTKPLGTIKELSTKALEDFVESTKPIPKKVVKAISQIVFRTPRTKPQEAQEEGKARDLVLNTLPRIPGVSEVLPPKPEDGLLPLQQLLGLMEVIGELNGNVIPLAELPPEVEIRILGPNGEELTYNDLSHQEKLLLALALMDEADAAKLIIN